MTHLKLESHWVNFDPQLHFCQSSRRQFLKTADRPKPKSVQLETPYWDLARFNPRQHSFRALKSLIRCAFVLHLAHPTLSIPTQRERGALATLVWRAVILVSTTANFQTSWAKLELIEQHLKMVHLGSNGRPELFLKHKVTATF